MKRKASLSLVLVLALIFTTVFASGSAYAGTVVDENNVSVTTIEAQTANSVLSEDDGNLDINEDVLIRYVADVTPGTNSATIIPVEVSKKGTLMINVDSDAAGSVNVSLHATESCTDTSLADYYLTTSNISGYMTAKLPDKGTYYLKFEAPSYSGTTCRVQFSVILFPNGGTLTRSKTYFGASADGKVSYYKVTAPGTGYFKISFPAQIDDGYATYQVKVANASKNSKFKNYVSVSSNGTTYAGVTKGTYYIMVKTSSSGYGLKVSYTKVSESSGSSKAKAKSITKGKTKSGIVSVTQSTSVADWYKFKISSTQKVTMELSGPKVGGSTGGIKMSFYQSGKSSPFSTCTVRQGEVYTFTPYTTGHNMKLTAGTYYVKVQKTGDGNGKYTIKWNK